MQKCFMAEKIAVPPRFDDRPMVFRNRTAGYAVEIIFAAIVNGNVQAVAIICEGYRCNLPRVHQTKSG